MRIDKSQLELIRNKHNLMLVLLHGSQVDKKLHKQSDIDIAVVRIDRNKGLEYLELLKDLKVVFSTDNIDLSDITNADPLFLYSVISKSKSISGSAKDYDKIAKIAFHKYSDYQPILEEESAFVRKKIKSYVTA